MKPEQQHRKIAEACGWTDIQVNPYTLGSHHPRLAGRWSQGEAQPLQGLPDYLNDLNAINAAALTILNSASSQLNWNYCRILGGITGSGAHVTTALVEATAAQRSEALLKALGLWEAKNNPCQPSTTHATLPHVMDRDA